MPDHTESPRPEPADVSLDRQVEIAEVGHMTMLQLLQTTDKRIVDGVRRLLAEHPAQSVTASWSSHLDPGAGSDETYGAS